MPQVPLFGVGLRGKSPVVSGQRRINCYVEIQKEEDKTRLAIYGTPGLSLFSDTGSYPWRGAREEGDLVYFVSGDKFQSMNAAGAVTELGSVATSSGFVGIESNGNEIGIVDGANGYTYNKTTGVFAQIAAAGFPSGAKTLAYQGGYFIAENQGSGQYNISGLYDATSWDALDFSSAEESPDELIRVFAIHGQLVLFGNYTTEFAANVGSTDFPFQPVKGAAQEVGLAARWSIAKMDQGVMFLGRTRLGQVQVMRLIGYQVAPQPDLEFDSIINGYANTADATAYSEMRGGHPIYRINFPSEGTSWEFDVTTAAWSERTSGTGRHRGELSAGFLGDVLITDFEDGRVYRSDPEVYTDAGETIERQIETRHFFKDYDRVIVDRLVADFETGVGLVTGQGMHPEVMLQISNDNGRTWGHERWESMGAIGEYSARVRWARLGLGRDFVFRFRMSDPVKFALSGGSINATPVGT